MSVSVVPDLDLADLSLWLVDFDAGPVVFRSFRATISTIFHSKLVLTRARHFIERDKVVFVVELVDGWEVSVLLGIGIDWQVRLRVFPAQYVGKLVL